MNKDCSTCICKEGSCYPSTTIFDKDKTCKSYEPDYEGYIAELEKENAELKEQCSILADCNTCISACKTENIEMKNNLTKAKEIIKNLLSAYTTYADSFDDRDNEIVEEAEQFIKDSEVPKWVNIPD